MKQFQKILLFELKYYFKNKIFVGVTVFFVLAIGIVMFFPRILDTFQTENEQDQTSKEGVILIKAEELPNAEMIVAAFENAFSNYNVTSTTDSLEKIKEEITSTDSICAFVFESDTSYTYYVDNLSLYDTKIQTADAILQNLYRMNAMISGGMTPEQANQILSLPISHTVESIGKNQAENYWYTYIMIFALYMVILLYGQMIATNVATEKSSRAMELLITSAKPINMMFGKIIASCCAGFVQLIALFGSAILFYNMNKDHWGENPIIASIFDMPLSLFAYMLVFFVLGFLIYAFLYGAIGSTASKLEDINTSVMPVTMLFIVGFMVVMFSFSSGNVDSLLLKVCSYIPFTSSMAMFTRIAMSTVAWYEIAISIGILAVSVIGIGYLSAKIYRMGVLLYGTPPKLKNMLKLIWTNR